MVWLLFFLISMVPGTELYGMSLVSKGSLTEGLFILQNKEREAREAIQAIKQELTACFAVLHPHDAQKRLAEPQKDLEIYHCKLKQLILPTYIDELARLATRNSSDIEHLMKSSSLDQRIFDGIMKRSFLLHDKIKLEKQFLRRIFSFDSQKHEYVKKQRMFVQNPKNRTLHKEVLVLEQAIDEEERSLSRIRGQLITLNRGIFSRDLPQDVFLERLQSYSL